MNIFKIVRQMPLISLEDRVRAVGLINSGPPKQKTRSIFAFLLLYIFIHFLCTVRYSAHQKSGDKVTMTV